LEAELEEKDQELESKLRVMRHEKDRIVQQYDHKLGKSEQEKKIKELENQLEREKQYFKQRLTQLEQGQSKSAKGGQSKPPKSKKEGKAVDVQTDPDRKDELIKKYQEDLKILARQVTKVEMANVKRRQSFQEEQKNQ